MALSIKEPGYLQLDGPITFDNAALVAAEGEVVLSRCLVEEMGSRWQIDLGQLDAADSSAFSVFLSWMRFAYKHNIAICFFNIPEQLAALVKVCDMQDLMQGSVCEI